MNEDDHQSSPLFALTIEQQNAIELVMTGLSDREVAERVGVRRETVTRWRNGHPAFKAELNRRRTELWNNGMERIRLLFPEAVEAMRRVINDPNNPNQWRAALEVVKLIGIPEGFLRNCGPETPENVIESEAEHRKSIELFEGLMGKPSKPDLDEMIEELEKSFK